MPPENCRQPRQAGTSHSAKPPKNGGQAAGYSHLTKLANYANKVIGYTLGDTSSKSSSKSSCIKEYTPAFASCAETASHPSLPNPLRCFSPRGTCDTLAVGQIAGAGASGHSRPGCFATPCHARTCARYVVRRPCTGQLTQISAGFYFFRQYNARLVATKAALVHRFLTYLSRVCKSRLSKSPTGFSTGFPVSNDVLCAG